MGWKDKLTDAASKAVEVGKAGVQEASDRKEEKKQEKIDAKQAKRDQKVYDLLAKYQLDFLADRDPADIQLALRAVNGMAAANINEATEVLTFSGSANEKMQQAYQRGAFYENLIIIRQLDRLNENIEKLIEISDK